MNIRENIIGYVNDKNYLVSIYDNTMYVFKYLELVSCTDSTLIVKLESKLLKLEGKGLKIVKMTKEELMAKGEIKQISFGDRNE